MAETTPATGTEPTSLATGAEPATPTTGATATGTESTTDPAKQQAPLTQEAIEKIIQSRVDKGLAQERKEKAELQKELEGLKKDKMSADELQKYELEKERAAIEAQKLELADKANRITAINELTKVDLYDGSENANTLLDLIVSGVKDEAQIVENVKAFKSVVDKLVAEQVDKTFKTNGRTPNGGGKGGAAETKPTYAEEIGKKKAEATKKSNEILNHYYGR